MAKTTAQNEPAPPQVAVIMGSKSDWDTMRRTSEMLTKLGIPNEAKVLSAHRTPAALLEYLGQAETRGVKVFIAAAGGAAHLGGVVAAHTLLPVIGVPMESPSLKGLDSLLSIVQMPGGIPVSCMAIGKAGATNAALAAASILAVSDEAIREKLRAYREDQARKILAESLD